MSQLPSFKVSYTTDRKALAFIVLAMCYLFAGVCFGAMGGLQYVFPGFLKDQLAFQKMRPLHVYLVISWIFTAVQGCIYYFMPRIARQECYWKQGVSLHFYLQVLISLAVVVSFFTGHFGGREYLEFPAWIGALMVLSWIPFAINFFKTIKPYYRQAPVYQWQWTTGILFFIITLSESYLWLLPFFRDNVVRDVTVQWKALGSMVGAWNMLVYGTGLYVMEQMQKDKEPGVARNRLAYLFFFIGATNLMFNWGHHTYIVPSASWVKTVAYVISMTELVLLANLIYQWRKTITRARKNYHHITYRLLSFADVWILLNLAVSILMSVPAINYYTHGTHITVAHAMGATIGINSMLLFAAVLYIVQQEKSISFELFRKRTGWVITITNISLFVFWVSLIAMGLVKMATNMHAASFYDMMNRSMPYFKWFAFSGILMLAGLCVLAILAIRILYCRSCEQAGTVVKKGSPHLGKVA